MAYTQADIERDGFQIKAAPEGDWRSYDPQAPVPPYFGFDWFSARHPDLYHRFALSTEGLMRALDDLVDLSGLDVLDVGAGTGRSAMGAARRARSVTALDAYEAVVLYGQQQVRQAGLGNIAYLRGNRDSLPFAESAFDALINSWAELNEVEAYRVLKPGGWLIRLGAPLEALCGELSAVLAGDFPEILQGMPPAAWFEPGCPAETTQLWQDTWAGLTVFAPVVRHDFTYTADYGDAAEAAAIFGRLYGPTARRYFEARRQSTCTWRLRIEACRVRK